MNEIKQSTFEGWAIVELLGHQREIGFVTTRAFGQAVLFQIDTPELPEREFVLTSPEYTSMGADSRSWTPAGAKVKRAASPARSRLVAPGSLYAINPCTELAAREALEQIERELILIEAPPRHRRITPPIEDEDDDEFVDMGHENEDAEYLDEPARVEAVETESGDHERVGHE
jgi:hypothetical protein